MKKSYGFTLSEALIAVFIIGIVATLTIRMLIAKMDGAFTPVKVEKYQDVIEGSVKMMMYKKRFSNLAGKYADSNAFADDFKKQFTLMKDCGTGTGCFPAGVKYKYLNPGYTVSVALDDTTEYKVILSDGSSMSFSWTLPCNMDFSIGNGTNPLTQVCTWVHIDINGINPPNQVGRDLFQWWILKDGKVIPTGTPDDTLKGCDPSSTDLTRDDTGAPGEGNGCTSYILETGKIDY